MPDVKDLSLKEALQAVGVRELPKRYDNSSSEIWADAIVLVRKADMSQSYALASRRGDGFVRYSRDFGKMSPIVGLISVHPYMYLDKSRFFHYNDKNEKLHAIAIHKGEALANEAKMWDDARIDAFLIDIGIELQRKSSLSDIQNNAIEDGENLESDGRDSDKTSAATTSGNAETIEADGVTEHIEGILAAKPRRGRKPKSKNRQDER